MASNPGIQTVNPAWPWKGSAATPSGLAVSSDPGSGGVDLVHHGLHRAMRPRWRVGPLSSGQRSPSPMGDFDSVARFYHTQRPHSALDDLPPAQFKQPF